MKPFLVCATLLLCSLSASAQALWRGVPAGSTPAEVSALVPEARPTDRSSPTDGRVLLVIAAEELVGTPFEVAFGFENNQLQSVVLQAQAGSPQEAQTIAQRVTASLRSRYGLEISTKSRQDPLTVGIDRKWSYRRTSLHLQVLDGTLVSLRYRPDIPRSASQPL
jgi:hypothetical protein